nr:hypothetical protein [uncultured Desulfobulbus sp.]
MVSSTQLKARAFVLLASFFAVLVAIFMPLFPGVHGGKINGLDYLDNFFNQLSKGSAYYIDKQLKKVEKYAGQEFSTSMKMKSADEAATVAKLFTTNNIPAEVDDVKVKVKGDFGAMLTIMLNDADLMYKNDGKTISSKYGVDERKALISWYNALTAMEKDLTKAEKFEQAQVVKSAMTKAVEPAYNYYKVEAKSVKAEMVLLIASLAFYVIYTMWYGFGLLFLFEGIGIKLEH